jgi:hypothetical protein
MNIRLRSVFNQNITIFQFMRTCLSTILICCSILTSAANAQQAIINLPSADITPKGKFFIMNESFVNPWTDSNKWKATNFFTYGINENFELALTNYGINSGDIDNLVFAPGFKYSKQLFKQNFSKNEFKITAGFLLPISFNGNGVGSNTFGHLSFRLPKTRTRLTLGANTGTEQIYGRDIFCFIGGIEHPITKEINLILEYYSGTHELAGLIPGIVYHNHKHDYVLVMGYRIPNNRESGEDGFVFELGKYF